MLDILLAALVAALAAETSVVLLAAYILALVRIDGGELALQNAAAELLHRRPEATRALLSDPTVSPSIVHAVHNALEQLGVHDCTDTASSNRTEPCGTARSPPCNWSSGLAGGDVLPSGGHREHQ